MALVVLRKISLTNAKPDLIGYNWAYFDSKLYQQQIDR